MKVLLSYWIIGCVIVGVPLGHVMERCPNDKVNVTDLVSAVAVWPVFVAAALTIKGKLPTTACGGGNG